MKIVRPDFTPRLLEAHTRPMLPRTDGPLRVGILHNRKQNADVLIGRLATNLAHDLGGEVSFVDAKDPRGHTGTRRNARRRGGGRPHRLHRYR